jgi:hypothetical protein
MSLSHRRSMNLTGDTRTTRRIQFGPICARMPESAPNRNLPVKRPFPSRKASLPSELFYQSDLMREPWVRGAVNVGSEFIIRHTA